MADWKDFSVIDTDVAAICKNMLETGIFQGVNASFRTTILSAFDKGGHSANQSDLSRQLEQSTHAGMRGGIEELEQGMGFMSMRGRK